MNKTYYNNRESLTDPLIKAQKEIEYLKANCQGKGYDKIDVIQRYLDLLNLSPNDDHVKELLLIAMNKLALRDKLIPNAFRKNCPIQKELPDEGIMIGFAMDTGALVRIPQWTLNRHGGIFGGSGSGKTNAEVALACQLQKYCSLIVFDVEGEYKNFIPFLGDALYLPWNTLKLNPLEGANYTDQSMIVSGFRESFTNAFQLLDASASLLSLETSKLLKLYSAKTDRLDYPSLFDLRDLIQKDLQAFSRSDKECADRILNKLNGLLEETGELFNCSKGLPDEFFNNNRVIINVQGLEGASLYFIASAIFGKIFESHDIQTMGQNHLRTVIIIDEAAKTLFDKNRDLRIAGNIPRNCSLFTLARKRGIGIIYSEQNYDKLSDMVTNNTSIYVIFRQPNGAIRRKLAVSLSLNREQEEELGMLPVGQAIIYSPIYPKPFKVLIPSMETLRR